MKNLEKRLILTYGNGIKWVVIGGLTGGIVGSVAAYFAKGIQIVSQIRSLHPLLIGLLPFAGILIVFSYRLCSVKEPKGTNLVLESIQNGENLPSYMAPLIILATILSHLFGASVGREGAALQLGSSMGSIIGKVLRLKEKDRRRIMMCGMSAAFSGLFGTPLAASVLAMEICTVGHMYYTALLPCTVSALVANFFAEKVVHVIEPELHLSLVSEIDWKSALATILLAILASMVSVLFVLSAHKAKALFTKYFKNSYFRIFVCGLILIIGTLLVGSTDYNGTGMDIIVKTITESGYKVFFFAFLLKILFTSISLGGGYQGGEIVPSLFIGATLGNALQLFLPLDPGLCAALGMASVFCSVTNCPLATLLICFELFGFQASSYFILAIAISYLCSGNYGLYHTQKILFSKTEEKEINELAH